MTTTTTTTTATMPSDGCCSRHHVVEVHFAHHCATSEEAERHIHNASDSDNDKPHQGKEQQQKEQQQEQKEQERSQSPVAAERYFYVNVKDTIIQLLKQEDTDNDYQITVRDAGPKSITLKSAMPSARHQHELEVRGTYSLGLLLQELAIAMDQGKEILLLAESKLTEDPVDRLSRMIKDSFWDGLTRAIDRQGMRRICQDPKNRAADQTTMRLYVPYGDAVSHEYYTKSFANKDKDDDFTLQIIRLPADITPEYAKSIDFESGILSLALSRPSASAEWTGVPFVVPGGRFNEMYGWDSYFETLGLIVDGRVDLGRAMVDNFCYQIHYYGKILNANRSYYLTRSQPPFLTDMALSVHSALEKATTTSSTMSTAGTAEERRRWLARVLLFAIREYYTVWTAAPRFHDDTGLSLYRTTGIGIPPETEASHFDSLLAPYAAKYNVDIPTFIKMYYESDGSDREGQLCEPELDMYFMHDRAVRESGHDTTYRFDNRCSNLLTVDLNSLLHKYESDIADMIDLLAADFIEAGAADNAVDICDAKGAALGAVPVADVWAAKSGIPEYDAHKCQVAVSDAALEAHAHLWRADTEVTTVPAPLCPVDYIADGATAPRKQACHWETSALWRERAARRRATMEKLMWNEREGMFFDYDFCESKQSTYVSAVSFWTLWARVATPAQAARMVAIGLPRLEMAGGIVAGTEESRGEISLTRPNRQWDYPHGWAPHQMLLWRGLSNYAFNGAATRMAYRWMYTITKAFVDFNGVVPEKFDVVTLNHLLSVEYGNVGVDFKYIPREGFGWMNASFKLGLTYLLGRGRNDLLKKCLGSVCAPEDVVTSFPQHMLDATITALQQKEKQKK